MKENVNSILYMVSSKMCATIVSISTCLYNYSKDKKNFQFNNNFIKLGGKLHASWTIEYFIHSCPCIFVCILFIFVVSKELCKVTISFGHTIKILFMRVSYFKTLENIAVVLMLLVPLFIKNIHQCTNLRK